MRKLEKPNQYGGTYEGTDGLTEWVNALCRVPWPCHVWIIPGQDGTP